MSELQLPEALLPWIDGLMTLPDRVERLVQLAQLMRQRKKPDWVVPLIRLAQSLAVDDPVGQWALRRFWDLPSWHCSILNDSERAYTYEQALRQVIQPGDLVLEIGTGSGILALLAARAGASHVITCETNPFLVDAAREIIATNGFSDRITVIHKSSRDLELGEDLPRHANVLIGDLFTGSLNAGGGLPLYQDAMSRLMTSGARTLPCRGGMNWALVSSTSLGQRYQPNQVAGFDVRLFGRFLPETILLSGEEWQGHSPRLLSVPSPSFELSFTQTTAHQPVRQEIKLRAAHSGQMDGLVGWVWLELAKDLVMDGRSSPAAMPWRRYWFPLQRSIYIEEGESLTFWVDLEARTLMVTIPHT